MFEATHAEIEKIEFNSPVDLYLSAMLSTSHLRPSDIESLDELCNEKVHSHIMKRNEGYLIKLCILDKAEIEAENKVDLNHNYHEGFSENFNHIMQYCTVNRIGLIEFDGDGKISPLFEVCS